MSKVVGFLIESTSAIPTDKILKAALRHSVFIVDKRDENLCSINSKIRSMLGREEWRGRKYDVLDNLSYFLDERRVQQCDLVARVDASSNITIHKDHPDLRK